jgi:hypothetical protein
VSAGATTGIAYIIICLRSAIPYRCEPLVRCALRMSVERVFIPGHSPGYLLPGMSMYVSTW